MKRKKESKNSRKNKIARWLYKNSIIYRTISKLFKKKISFYILMIILILFGLYSLYFFSNIYFAKETVKLWVRAINDKNMSLVEKLSDYSKENPYRLTLPEKEFIENSQVHLNLEKFRGQKYQANLSGMRVEALIDYIKGIDEKKLNMIFMLKKRNGFLYHKWIIIGVEIIDE
jgi:hypothetical protein